MNKKPLMNLPSIDAYSSRREWEAVCWRKILKSEDLLESLITAHERHNLVMRAAALKELVLGKGPRQISRELFVSLQTIGVLKKAMKENTYRSYLERSKQERKKKKYSVWPSVSRQKHRGRSQRTKYGTIYLPY